MKSITIAKGERAKVLSKFSNSLAMTYRFTAEPVHAGDTLSGSVEVSGSNWIIPKPARTQPLAQSNAVEKGVWDTFYSVSVVPDCDVTITLDGKSMGHVSRTLILAALIVAVAVSIVILVRVL